MSVVSPKVPVSEKWSIGFFGYFGAFLGIAWWVVLVDPTLATSMTRVSWPKSARFPQSVHQAQPNVGQLEWRSWASATPAIIYTRTGGFWVWHLSRSPVFLPLPV